MQGSPTCRQALGPRSHERAPENGPNAAGGAAGGGEPTSGLGAGGCPLALGQAVRMESLRRHEAAPGVAVVQLAQQGAHALAQARSQRLGRRGPPGRGHLHPQVLQAALAASAHWHSTGFQHVGCHHHQMGGRSPAGASGA